ncbi:hypothetical protein H4B97_07515 [Pseudomonas juntendi]|uniref:Ead/Ea22-like family protein n=1 Tax=Pseudomonas juntendi TaxID=2666183 RepID=A0A7W2LK06_9PSED|nr:ead/Ea22-like family protein [Pseudomonas juntendi]MBA6142321.1 hypothetical protein [Pseudomonas juntendi]
MDTNKMTVDKEQLKSLAEASLTGDWYEAGDLRYEDRRTGDIHGLHHDDDRFIAAAGPATVLALLAEVEQLRDSHEQVCTNYNRVSFTSEERGKQIEQLKAENEMLRKSIAGKVVCDLELFEDLRDSAAAEADQHRQSMGSYRPQRQEVLDHTVSRCDLLIAAAKEVSHG